MHRLGLIDHALLKLETAGGAPSNMTGAMIVDPADSPFPVDALDLADHVIACMEEIPLMRQRLVQDPLRVADVRVVDAPNFDPRDHVKVMRLEKPGGHKELTERLSFLCAQRMDLTKPLWRIEIIDGLEHGRLAVFLQLHHSILDGEGATQALGGIFNNKPVAAKRPRKQPWKSQAVPGPFRLLTGALLESGERLWVRYPAFLVKNAPPLLKLLARRFDRQSVSSAQNSLPKLPEVRFTSLNVASLSEKRSVSFAELPLKEVKALRKHYGCSVNDLVLVLSAHALQHYFNGIGERVDHDLICGMPMSLRDESDESGGNNIKISRVNLYNASLPDIEEQLLGISKDTAVIKDETSRNRAGSQAKSNPASIDFVEFGSLFSPMILEVLFYLGIARFNLPQKFPMVNLAITNVPGPQETQYIAGARLVTSIPMAPCVPTVGLTISTANTDENLSLGFHGCGEAIKNRALFEEGVELAFEELKKRASASKRKTATPRCS